MNTSLQKPEDPTRKRALLRLSRHAALLIGVACVAAFSLAAVPAQARSIGVTDTVKRPDRNYANFRLGASAAADRAEMCMEISPHERIGFEACGTGATWLHTDNAPDMMHLRALFRIGSYKTPVGFLQPRVGAGVAEIAIAADEGGLYFSGVGPTAVETAGPEATASLRLLTPVYGGFELLTNLDFTAAYFAHAGKLLKPRDSFQPGMTFSLGFGF